MANEFKVKNGLIAPTLQSTVATGTAPLTVASTTAVTNLNADYLDGQHGSYYSTAGNLSGTLPSAVLGNSSLYIGTTAITLNRSSASQTLTGVSIDGSAGSATTATHIAGGAANKIHYQTGAGSTSFIDAPSASDTYLKWNGTAFTWATVSGGSGGITTGKAIAMAMVFG